MSAIADSALPTGATARFSIGIDLGTAFAPVLCGHAGQRWRAGRAAGAGRFPSSQPRPAWKAARCCLPSSTCRTRASSAPPTWPALGASRGMPWPGEFARQRGAAAADTPGGQRRAGSATPAWIGRAPLLPADAPPEVERISPGPPAPATCSILRQAWDAAHLGAVRPAGHHRHHPASFDPAARG